MNTLHNLNDFSPHLFWDVDKTKLDWKENRSYIVHRVLEYGLMTDWKLVYNYYGLKQIAEIAAKLRELEPRAMSFIAALSGLPKETFRCYTTKHLMPPHWNF